MRRRGRRGAPSWGCSFTPKARGQERETGSTYCTECPVRRACGEQKWLLRGSRGRSCMVMLLLLQRSMEGRGQWARVQGSEGSWEERVGSLVGVPLNFFSMEVGNRQ